MRAPFWRVRALVLCPWERRRHQDLASPAIHVDKAFSVHHRPKQGLRRTLNGELQGSRPADGYVPVNLDRIVLEVELVEFFARHEALKRAETFPDQRQVEQTLAAEHGREILAHDDLLDDRLVASEEESVRENDPLLSPQIANCDFLYSAVARRNTSHGSADEFANGAPCLGSIMTRVGNTDAKSLPLRVINPWRDDAHVPISKSASGFREASIRPCAARRHTCARIRSDCARCDAVSSARQS